MLAVKYATSNCLFVPPTIEAMVVRLEDQGVRCESLGPEAPPRAEFLQKRLISAFFGFQWQNLAEILHLFKKYNNLRKVAVRE